MARAVPAALAFKPRKIRLLRWLALLFAVDALVSTATVGLNLERAAFDLHKGVQAARAGRTDDALRRFDGAATKARVALGALSSPTLSLAGSAGLRDDVDGLELLASVARRAADTGRQLAVAGDRLATNVYSDGAIQEAGLAEVTSLVGRVATTIHDLIATLDTAAPPRFGVISDALTEARSELTAGARSVARTAALLAVTPALAGFEEPHTYLLAFQSPAEARAGGGLIGLYATLRFEEGRAYLSDTAGIGELRHALKHPVAAPAWFEKAYGSLSARSDPRLVNLSPDFPTTARLLLAMHEQVTGAALDGAIALDPIALGKLTKATGPLSGTGWDKAITSDSARRVLLHDVYTRFGRWRAVDQNLYLQSLVEDLWTSLSGNDVAASELVPALADAAGTGHLKIYDRDPAIESALANLHLNGSPASYGGRVQMAFNNNWSANKVDYYLDRSIDTTITLQPSGNALVATSIELKNRAPIDQPNLLVRPGVRSELPLGINLMSQSLMLPMGARIVDYRLNGVERTPRRSVDNGYPVVSSELGLTAGNTARIDVTYAVDDLTTPGFLYFTLVPQASVRPDAFSLTIVPVGGMQLRSDAGNVDDDGAFRLRGLMKTARRVSVRVQPAT